MTLTAEQLKVWRAFCEWLDEQKRKCAHYSAVPDHWRRLVYRGGNPTGQRARDVRWEVQLIFYQTGWGWRLKKNWRERLAELEKGFAGESGKAQPDVRDGRDARS